eukprot:sb/3473462/
MLMLFHFVAIFFSNLRQEVQSDPDLVTSSKIILSLNQGATKWGVTKSGSDCRSEILNFQESRVKSFETHSKTKTLTRSLDFFRRGSAHINCAAQSSEESRRGAIIIWGAPLRSGCLVACLHMRASKKNQKRPNSRAVSSGWGSLLIVVCS